jgi:fructokinase
MHIQRGTDKLPRIFAIGETTYDIQFRNGIPSGGCGGGSAYNSAISLGRCGLPVSLISTFAYDRIGDLAQKFLLSNQVDCSGIQRFEGRSRIALAFFDENQIPEYSFYPASEEAIPDYPDPRQGDIILLGSSFALKDRGRTELLEFLRKSKALDCTIIYDPNARLHLADDPYLMKKIMENISLATIVKGSDEDFHFIFGTNGSEEAYHKIQKQSARILFYTKGPEGVELFTPNLHLQAEALKIQVISTIGAGDNFSAGVVFGLFHKFQSGIMLENFSHEDWQYISNLGNYFAASVCQSSDNYISMETAHNLKKVQPF